MTHLPRSPMCPGCAQGQALLYALTAKLNDEEIGNDEVIDSLPLLLETILSKLLSEFDYEENLESNTAEAIRLLTIAAERAQVLYLSR